METCFSSVANGDNENSNDNEKTDMNHSSYYINNGLCNLHNILIIIF